jgi:beta-phosphoglucomutase-like phosphatase (HAD superfamily)
LNAIPLAVDLDGTLVRSDTLHEAALRALREHPLALLQLPFWLLQGKAVLKQRLAALSRFDPSTLPYHQPLITWLTEQRAQGRKLVLCTAADHSIATAISEHLGIFDEVIASDGNTNLGGVKKRMRSSDCLVLVALIMSVMRRSICMFGSAHVRQWWSTRQPR